MATQTSMPSGRVHVDAATSLYYELQGQGGQQGRLLMLTGGFCKLPWASGLRAVAVQEGYEVLINEPRGLGRSTAGPGVQTTSMLASDALAVADSVWGPEAEFWVLGFSLGGMVASEMVYSLAVAGETFRIRGVLICCSAAGNLLRPLPVQRASIARKHLVRGFQAAGKEAYAAKIPFIINAMFSSPWVDQPLSTDAPEPDAGTDAGATSTLQGPVITRRTALLSLFADRFNELMACDAAEEEAAMWHVTSLLSHYISPLKAARIRAANVPITVAVTPADTIIKPEWQHAMARTLGARRVVELKDAPGHCDFMFCDGPQAVLPDLLRSAFV